MLAPVGVPNGCFGKNLACDSPVENKDFLIQLPLQGAFTTHLPAALLTHSKRAAETSRMKE